MQSHQQVVNDSIMLELCKKIKHTPDSDVHQVAGFIEQNKDQIDLNYFSFKTGNWAPIHFAAFLSKEHMLRMLVKQGANPFLPIGVVDKKTGLRMTWKTGITLIPENLFSLRREIEQLFVSQNTQHNQNNVLLNYMEGIFLCHIAACFIEDKKSFSALYRTCTAAEKLLNESIAVIKKVDALQKMVKDKKLTADSNRTYNPYDDEFIRAPATGAEAMARRKEYTDLANDLYKESEKLELEIQQLKTSLTSKLTF